MGPRGRGRQQRRPRQERASGGSGRVRWPPAGGRALTRLLLGLLLLGVAGRGWGYCWAPGRALTSTNVQHVGRAKDTRHWQPRPGKG